MGSTPETCLMKGCGEPVYIRGLCRKCYQAAYRQIVAGEVTWEQLVAARKALAARPAGKRRRKITEDIKAIAARAG